MIRKSKMYSDVYCSQVYLPTSNAPLGIKAHLHKLRLTCAAALECCGAKFILFLFTAMQHSSEAVRVKFILCELSLINESDNAHLIRGSITIERLTKD